MVRTFKKKDLMFLKKLLTTGRHGLNRDREEFLIRACAYLISEEYREYAPHESGKILINK